MPRFTGFRFQSPHNYRGEVAHRLPGVPARDLDKRDVARLSDEAYEAVKAATLPDGEPLYAPIKRRKSKSAGDAAEDNGEACGAGGDNTEEVVAGETPAADSSEAETPAE
jgi:hypothetical protein